MSVPHKPAVPAELVPAHLAPPKATSLRTRYLPLVAYLTMRGHPVQMIESDAARVTFVFSRAAEVDERTFQSKSAAVEPLAYFHAIEDIRALLRSRHTRRSS